MNVKLNHSKISKLFGALTMLLVFNGNISKDNNFVLFSTAFASIIEPLEELPDFSKYVDVKEKLLLTGYKILIDIILSHKKKLKIKEIFINFRERNKGFSKMRLKILLQLMMFIIIKFSGNKIREELTLFLIKNKEG